MRFKKGLEVSDPLEAQLFETPFNGRKILLPKRNGGVFKQVPIAGIAFAPGLFGPPPFPAHFCLADFTLDGRRQALQLVFHQKVVRAGLHGCYGNVLIDSA